MWIRAGKGAEQKHPVPCMLEHSREAPGLGRLQGREAQKGGVPCLTRRRAACLTAQLGL